MRERTVVAHVGDRYVVVEVPPTEVKRVLVALQGVLDDPKRDLGTVTGVRYGFGFRVPVQYANAVHRALFGGQVAYRGDEAPEVDTGATDGGTAPTGAPDVPEGSDAPQAPKGNAKRADWAAFLDDQGITYPDDATRDELRELWEDLA